MFSVLIESEPRVPQRGRWMTGSAAVHGVLVATAIAATMHPLVAGPAPVPQLRQIIFTRPAPPAPSTPTDASSSSSHSTVSPALRMPRLDVVTPTLHVTDPTLPISLDPQSLLRHAFRPPGDAPGDRGDPNGTGGVLRPAQVDRAVIADATNGAPRYPVALRAARVEGEVLVRFVVDTLGRVEPASITIVRTAHGAFADAVTAWLSRNRYTPADVGGRAVRQLVEQRVEFSLQK